MVLKVILLDIIFFKIFCLFIIYFKIFEWINENKIMGNFFGFLLVRYIGGMMLFFLRSGLGF